MSEMIVPILKYSAALVVVLGGVVWCAIWLVSTLKEKPWLPARAVWQSAPNWVLAVWAVTLAYTGYYYVFAMIVGGTLPRHPPQDGKYWLFWSGKSTEVSRSLYHLCAMQEGVLFAMVLLSLFALSRLPKRVARPTP